jgi:hypothetical protein
VRLSDREVVDVDLAALLLGLVENISRNAAHDRLAIECGERDEGVAA